jgi:outer membrane protein TolC
VAPLGLGAIILSAVPSALLAQGQPVSLAEALDLAARRNPEILAQRARADAHRAKTELAGRANWPRLALASGWSRTNTPSSVFAQKLNAGELTQDDFALERLNSPDALSHLTTTLAAELPLDLFGKLSARTRAQSESEMATRQALDETLLDLRLRVVEAYRRAALARRVVDVTEKAVAGALAREADVEARVAQGSALKAELLRIRARRRERQAELGERRADAEIAAAALGRAVGAEPGVAYEATEMATAPPPLAADGASWVSRALAERPLLRETGERVKAQEWSVRAEGRSNRPDLVAWGQVQDDRNGGSGGNQSGAFGVLLRWNAFDPTRSKRVAGASAELRAAELEAHAASAQVRLEAETAWRRAQAARERYAAAAGGTEEGREALRVIQERRQEGLATLTDELETEAASLAAELEELRAASEAAVADAALLRATGGL